MARPFKKGLDYFPFNVYFLENRKIQRLRKIYGNVGLVVYLAILFKYREEIRKYKEL
ncbi:Lin1244/Lin1753 domain-containing protein [Parabacteroides pacaensis]|uniref:Lin1244/Lin1753 domain-containing protein n=1 Tax=Parabacteroides pacaensis TaxID=2086575 RepID=UPI000D106DFC|nr:Lin1244/Lin1753 domain-containing protein [Parabacteroides pacaensis]